MNKKILQIFFALVLPLAAPMESIGADPAVSAENTLSILPEGQKNLQELLDLVNSAKSGDKIRLSTYILTDDAIGRTVMQALAQAGERGADVHVIIDPSNYRLPDRFVHFLENSKVKVKEFHPMGGDTAIGKAWKALTQGVQWMNNRSHDKMLVVERATSNGVEHVAFMGSSNLVDAHFQLDPTMLFEKNPSLLKKAMVVLQVARDRIGRYLSGGGKDPAVINSLIDEAVAAEAKGNLTFSQEVKARLTSLRNKYHDLGYQYLDVNYLVKGQVAKDLIAYHDSVWADTHAQPRVFNEKIFNPNSPIHLRIKELEGYPVVLDSAGKKVTLNYDRALYDAVNAAPENATIELGAKNILVDAELQKAIARQQLQFEIPTQSQGATGNLKQITASPDQIRAFLTAKEGEIFRLDGIQIPVREDLKAAARGARLSVRIPSGALVDLSFADLELIKNTPLGQKVSVGGKFLVVDAEIKKQVLLADPDALTKSWVEKGSESLKAVGYIESIEKKNSRPFSRYEVGKIDLYVDKMTGNVPQGSEQGPLDAFRRAKGGDTVKVQGQDVLYTADLFNDLEKSGLGDTVEIGGKPVVLTQDIMEKFAAATPADEMHLLNQYGQLTPEVRDEMIAASKRGVKINFVVNGEQSMWDGKLPVRGYELTFDDLVSTGARVIEYPSDNKQIHAKIFTVTNGMGRYVPTDIEKRYPANPKNPGFLKANESAQDGKMMFKDFLKQKLANEPLNPRHVAGFTVTGTSNIDARSMSKTIDDVPATGIMGRIKAWSRRLRNTELNLGIDSAGFAEEMKGKIYQAGAGGRVVADRGKRTNRSVKTCPKAYSLLAPLI